MQVVVYIERAAPCTGVLHSQQFNMRFLHPPHVRPCAHPGHHRELQRHTSHHVASWILVHVTVHPCRVHLDCYFLVFEPHYTNELNENSSYYYVTLFTALPSVPIFLSYHY